MSITEVAQGRKLGENTLENLMSRMTQLLACFIHACTKRTFTLKEKAGTLEKAPREDCFNFMRRARLSCATMDCIG